MKVPPVHIDAGIHIPEKLFCGVVQVPALFEKSGAGGKKVSPVGGGVAVTVAPGEQQVTVDGPGQRRLVVVPVQVAVRLQIAAEFRAVHLDEITPAGEGQHRISEGPRHSPDLVDEEQV